MKTLAERHQIKLVFLIYLYCNPYYSKLPEEKEIGSSYKEDSNNKKWQVRL